MDVDENMLISEVARKRAVQSGDRETEEFIRREQARIRREQQMATNADATPMQRPLSAGSSEEALEREIIKYLLKAGHKNFEVKEHYNIVSINIADEIFRNLDADNIVFSNRVYNILLTTYRERWQELGVGVEVGAQYFVNHPDPEVCNAAVDILTSDDNYVPSNIWQRKDVHVESEEEILSAGVPKAIMLYRSKVVERMIKVQLERLADSSLSEQDEAECIKQLDLLNKVKAQLAKESQRLIL